MARHAAQPTLAGSGVCLLLQVLFTFQNHVCTLPSPYSLSLSQGEERVSDAPEREREREREIEVFLAECLHEIKYSEENYSACVYCACRRLCIIRR